MVKCLLDTNVISELRKKDRMHQGLDDWWQSIDIGDVYLSVLVLGELRQGIEMLRLRNSSGAARLENWLDTVAAGFGARVLPVSLPVADTWGKLGVRRTLPLVDSLLAATAITHDLTLVTRNVRDIRDTGVRYLNPFEE